LKKIGGGVAIQTWPGIVAAGDRVSWAIVASCGNAFFVSMICRQKCVRSVKYGHESLQPGRELLVGWRSTVALAARRLSACLTICRWNCLPRHIVPRHGDAAIEAAGDLRDTVVCVLARASWAWTVSAIAKTQGRGGS